MNNPENDIQKLLSRVRFNDTSDPRHRDTLEQRLRSALSQAPRPSSALAEIWRTIMKNRFGKISAAAAVLVAILGVAIWSSRPNTTISSFTLITRASAAERTLFAGQNIIHIANEIVLHSAPASDPGALLKDLESGATEEKSIAFIQSWLTQRWFPFYSLGADGRRKEHKLDVPDHMGKTVTLSDLVWYEPASSRFVRVLKEGDQVLFANAYDGKAIYEAQKTADGRLEVKREAPMSEFKVPENPADFMGIAAGVTGSVPAEHYPPIQGVSTETGTNATQRVYKLGYVDVWGKLNTYFLIKINTDTNIIGEMDCVVDGVTTRVHRRLAAEAVNAAPYTWDLSELAADSMPQGGARSSVQTNKGAESTTASQMVERATFPTYVFSKAPSWAHDGTVYDLPDASDAQARMFSAIYKGKGGRDVVLTMGESLNRYFAALLKPIEQANQPISWLYESTSGFKATRQGDRNTELWWTELALKTAGFEPKADRLGYILMSPARTFVVLALNGPVSDDELHSVVDSLVPADKYVPNPTQP
jgi:hypothetical protein